MMPVRRDVHPHLPADRISNWHERGPHVTHFLNALSIFFPTGERPLERPFVWLDREISCSSRARAMKIIKSSGRKRSTSMIVK